MGDSERIIDTGMTEGDLLDWLDNLTAERIKPIYDPAIHVRAVDYAKRRGISAATAQRVLKELAERGELQEVEVMVNGRRGVAYMRKG